MGFNCGIVGLPNVGKSTLFNALTATQAAEAANFPFCTIEPNVGRVSVPDTRLDSIAAISKSQKIIPTQLEFVDIAGLVRGASKGEGLGNKFLANIRETDAICYVLRCFVDENVTHVEGSIDPVRDAETVETELMIADLESLEKRIEPLRKKATGKDRDAMDQLRLMEPALALLKEGKPARLLPVDEIDRRRFRALGLLTAKPVMYICNVDEAHAGTGNDLSNLVKARAEAEGAECVVICAALEAEIAQLGDAGEKAEFLEASGLVEPGLNKVIRAGYHLLDLITFFTTGPKETRAWTVRRNARAPEAAGQIHTDFERGFIRAETTGWQNFLDLGGEVACKEAGKTRAEGKEYVVQDGDIMLFRFNV